MLKKIPIEHLQIGMYVHDLCGSWLSHDFWRTSFAVDKPEILTKLRTGAVQEVWIDTSRGLDVPGSSPASAPPAALAAFTHDTPRQRWGRSCSVPQPCARRRATPCCTCSAKHAWARLWT